MPKGKRRHTREQGRFLARSRLEQMGYRVMDSGERGVAFYVLTRKGWEPVKVRTIRYGSWQFTADRLMDITVSRSGVQTIHGRKPQADEDMLCVLVQLDEEAFFVLRLGQLYDVVCSQYETWLVAHGGRRPRKPRSMHCSAKPEELAAYRDNWQLVGPAPGTATVPETPSSLLGTVRHITRKFCRAFVAEPYLCYTQHGLHALLFARLFDALWEAERLPVWEGRRVCVIQKEYPTAHPLGKSRRQHWDLAVLKTPLERQPEDARPAYDSLKLSAAIEVGLNAPQEHLRADLRRLLHREANLEVGFVLHLYRLSKPGAMVSARDWSVRSPRILPVESVAAILAEAREAETAAERPIEILYAVAGEAGPHERGVWLIRSGEAPRRVSD
ncbi:MAG: hypothetical protein PVJ23_00705 [Anaerolineae bacterium]|jgi:hypothetical protein